MAGEMGMRNYIREEVARLDWPEVIFDEASDREREIKALRKGRMIWRTAAVALLCHYALHLLGWVD